MVLALLQTVASFGLGRMPRPSTQFGELNARRQPGLFGRKDGNSDEGADMFLPLAGTAVFFTAFWPLLALFRDTNDPTFGFDVDMYMSLKGILESSPPDDLAITELPPLTPGERLVEAVFGVPSY